MTADLVAFLTARLDEDEAEQRQKLRGWHEPNCAVIEDVVYECDCGVPARVLADVAAKRRVIEECADELANWPGIAPGKELALTVLRLLALPFADHPDYRDEWKP